MAPPAVQAVAASGSSKGPPLFVAADPDLVGKEGVVQVSWFVVSHLMSGSDRLMKSIWLINSSLVRVIQNISLER
jgi:hypothetical protein